MTYLPCVLQLLLSIIFIREFVNFLQKTIGSHKLCKTSEVDNIGPIFLSVFFFCAVSHIFVQFFSPHVVMIIRQVNVTRVTVPSEL
jgi:hypothetical protein